ncbi:MAG: hypothetical protein AUG49_00175 [Catenulispora sp. 13_1_20CM_3_70_7]|nr:MAG: hypothetical protein AUG49_00175 [Catenulispora sp. 13_1_20CM_3_70_7]
MSYVIFRDTACVTLASGHAGLSTWASAAAQVTPDRTPGRRRGFGDRAYERAAVAVLDVVRERVLVLTDRRQVGGRRARDPAAVDGQRPGGRVLVVLRLPERAADRPERADLGRAAQVDGLLGRTAAVEQGEPQLRVGEHDQVAEGAGAGQAQPPASFLSPS